MLQLQEKIKYILYQLGVNSTYLGYYYLTLAIAIAIEEEENLLYISKNIYPRIAEQYHTSISCVERNIRTAADVMFRHGSPQLLAEIFIDNKNRPKNSRLISCLALYVKKQLSE